MPATYNATPAPDAAFLSEPVPQHVLIDMLKAFSYQRSKAARHHLPSPRPAWQNRSWRRDSDTRPFDGYRILVVDNSEVNLEVVTHMLKKLGCHTNTAANGRIAVTMASTQAIRSDFNRHAQMPELDKLPGGGRDPEPSNRLSKAYTDHCVDGTCT